MLLRTHRRTLLFGFLFLAVMLLAMAGNQAQLHAQSSAPGETVPPEPYQLFLSLISVNSGQTIPPQQPLVYSSLSVEGAPTDRPAEAHPDLNLSIRGYSATSGHLGLVNYGGDTDPQAPQIDGMFGPPRLPGFKTLFQVYDWDWACNPPDGCRGALISDYPVTLLEMTTTPGETISIPRRDPQIDAAGYRALVLYASERRLTITYTRRDSAAVGYLIHLEDFDVNPGLVALYRQLDAAGR
ncbi:MAG: hypothetical protein KDE24_31515, partial [Caldilinea sp.]|nr:hypothetical protein [Caldilinea sp.]